MALCTFEGTNDDSPFLGSNKPLKLVRTNINKRVFFFKSCWRLIFWFWFFRSLAVPHNLAKPKCALALRWSQYSLPSRPSQFGKTKVRTSFKMISVLITGMKIACIQCHFVRLSSTTYNLKCITTICDAMWWLCS